MARQSRIENGGLDQVAPTGAVVSSRQLDVYGKERSSAVTAGEKPSKQAFVGSLGHTTDAETGGLVYMRARYMDTATGRFISQDKGKQDTNWFIYCADNPTNCIDESGNAFLGDSIIACLKYILGEEMTLKIEHAIIDGLLADLASYLRDAAQNAASGAAADLEIAGFIVSAMEEVPDEPLNAPLKADMAEDAKFYMCRAAWKGFQAEALNEIAELIEGSTPGDNQAISAPKWFK